MIFKVNPAFETWPAADRGLWVALTTKGGPLDDAGALSHLRPTSLRRLMIGYARWLRWLAQTDREAPEEGPLERVHVVRLKAWMRSLEHLSPSTRLMDVTAVLRLAFAAAPERDWSAERRLRSLLTHEARFESGSRKTGRIFDSGALFDAGRDLAASYIDGDLAAALGVRDGSMIALLALMPLRLRAFAGLRLEHSLFVTPQGLRVEIDAELSKTGEPWAAPVPEPLEPVLRRYLDEARPVLLARGDGASDHLWIGAHGRSLDLASLSKRVAKVTGDALGVPIPPHFFRDAAATTLARTSPDAARLTRALLGHSSYRTAERHYNHAKGIEAGRDYAAVLDRLMAGEDDE